ncbi:10536_t:CDS:2 [Acaulospora morrowiae]|uniref:10536_t:CDS:1 n=1 Tax=Acaulospora morrowiae TaxID=94023 RepID=A0A9N9BBR5_9GLOM|nr:10536_t:CDS:2 [Acaulospora morrowiae]
MHLFSSINRNLILIASLILFCKISSYQLDFVGAVKLSREFHDYDDENLRNKLFIKIVKKDAQLIGFTDNYNNSTDGTNYVAVVNVVAVIFGNFDLVACSYVIYSAYIKGRMQSLSMSDRVPLYLSFSDVCQCKKSYHLHLIHAKLYLLNDKQPYDSWIWLQSDRLFVFPTDEHGFDFDDKHLRDHLPEGCKTLENIIRILRLEILCFDNAPFCRAVGTFDCITFVITCFCYIQTLYTIFNVDREEMTDSSERIDRWNKLERQAIKKIMIYITLFMMKWIPLMTFGIGIMSGYEDIWIFILFVISFNLGGICNCILYLMNGDSPEHNDSAPEQTTNSTASLSQKTNTNQSEVCQITLPPEAYIPQTRDSMADSVILNLEEKVLQYPSGSSEQNYNCSMIGDDESSGSDDDEIRVIGVA